jgi:hypothetical protein
MSVQVLLGQWIHVNSFLFDQRRHVSGAACFNDSRAGLKIVSGWSAIQKLRSTLVAKFRSSQSPGLLTSILPLCTNVQVSGAFRKHRSCCARRTAATHWLSNRLCRSIRPSEAASAFRTPLPHGTFLLPRVSRRTSTALVHLPSISANDHRAQYPGSAVPFGFRC